MKCSISSKSQNFLEALLSVELHIASGAHCAFQVTRWWEIRHLSNTSHKPAALTAFRPLQVRHDATAYINANNNVKAAAVCEYIYNNSNSYIYK